MHARRWCSKSAAEGASAGGWARCEARPFDFGQLARDADIRFHRLAAKFFIFIQFIMARCLLELA